VSEVRAFASIAIFALGIVGGIALHQIADRGPAENPFPSLPRSDEPAASRDVVAAIAADDPRTLAKLLTADQLNDLNMAMRPIVDVRKTKFVGAAESEGRLLAAYIVTGKNDSGTDFIVGFVLRVSNDQVVGVN
jgi:hypothetical protein